MQMLGTIFRPHSPEGHVIQAATLLSCIFSRSSATACSIADSASTPPFASDPHQKLLLLLPLLQPLLLLLLLLPLVVDVLGMPQSKLPSDWMAMRPMPLGVLTGTVDNKAGSSRHCWLQLIAANHGYKGTALFITLHYVPQHEWHRPTHVNHIRDS